jgi:hypothetical protein
MSKKGFYVYAYTTKNKKQLDNRISVPRLLVIVKTLYITVTEFGG